MTDCSCTSWIVVNNSCKLQTRPICLSAQIEDLDTHQMQSRYNSVCHPCLFICKNNFLNFILQSVADRTENKFKLLQTSAGPGPASQCQWRMEKWQENGCHSHNRSVQCTVLWVMTGPIGCKAEKSVFTGGWCLFKVTITINIGERTTNYHSSAPSHQSMHCHPRR